MIELDCINLDDKEYAIIERIWVNNNEYVYLANPEDGKDVMFRKVTLEDDGTYYSTLDTEEEFDKVVEALSKKLNKNISN